MSTPLITDSSVPSQASSAEGLAPSNWTSPCDLVTSCKKIIIYYTITGNYARKRYQNLRLCWTLKKKIFFRTNLKTKYCCIYHCEINLPYKKKFSYYKLPNLHNYFNLIFNYCEKFLLQLTWTSKMLHRWAKIFRLIRGNWW